MPLDDAAHSAAKPRRRVVFDPTINLGHVLTFIGFISTGVLAYQNLDRRQTVQETRFQIAQEHQREQDTRLKEALSELRADVKELRKTVEDFNRNAQRPQRP